MASDTLFRQKAPEIMRLLMGDFGLTVEDAAAVVGNLGHESAGFRFLQEKKPLVPGSRGGWGWAQWTGPRRKAFEAYCARNDLDPASDKANYGWLFVELKGSEAKAIPAVKKARGLEEKIKAFELSFERASPKYKHYPSRLIWAQKALAAFSEAPPLKAEPIPPEKPATSPPAAVIVPPAASTKGRLTKLTLAMVLVVIAAIAAVVFL